MSTTTNKPAPPARYWLSPPPTACDLCGRAIGKTFIDGATRGGPWGFMDLRCHRVHGLGIGQGRGQLYRLQADGRWLKAEG